jgi:hypothetical protein
MEQRKVAEGSVEEKVKSAVVELTVPDGPESMVRLGDVTSATHVREAGLASTLPNPSVALAENVWEASLSPV